MTAVVGILNKQGVALAADSAVTIGGPNGRKILNKANKVFALSKIHPVGIMIYNSASFMATPWETIIKIYRKQLGNKSHPTLRDYKLDFLNFLRTKRFFTTSETQLAFLEGFALEIVNSVLNEAIKNNIGLTENPNADNQKLLLQLFEKQLDALIETWGSITDYCDEFSDYTFKIFDRYSKVVFENIVQSRFTQNNITITDNLLLKIKQAIFTVLRSKEQYTNYTGLIFSGFGEEEIYPQLIPINVSMVVDNRLRFYINENRAASISNSNNGAVCPFAQTDVIDTILSGIDPSLEDIFLSNFDALFKKYNQAIIENLGETNELLKQQIQNLKTETIVKEFYTMNQKIKKENYINPLMNAVSSLSKEDLAEMAESLIYLTSLKRRITFAEESVGGPVDVAIISKGDGFIWIKRKHYFKPELNQHFFSNYFK